MRPPRTIFWPLWPVSSDLILSSTTSPARRRASPCPTHKATHNYVYNTYSGYLADSYKIARHLTLNAGLRYDYWTPVYDSQGQAFSNRVLENNNPAPNHLGSERGAELHRQPRPSLLRRQARRISRRTQALPGIFSATVKTSLRGGYSLSFFNDDAVISAIASRGREQWEFRPRSRTTTRTRCCAMDCRPSRRRCSTRAPCPSRPTLQTQ